MSLFPTILILKNTKIHVSFLNCCNITFNIEVFVYKVFYLGTVFKIPNINLDYSYISFERYFDNIRVKSKNNVIENVSRLKNSFDKI